MRLSKKRCMEGTITRYVGLIVLLLILLEVTLMAGSVKAAEGSLGGEVARFVEEAQGLFGGEQPPEALRFGRLRLFCYEDLEEVAAAGATLTIIHPMRFGRGDPFRMERAQFKERMEELRGFTRRAHEAGITVLGYISQNPSTSRDADPTGWVMSEVWEDEAQWSRYADFYGPRPAEAPAKWVQMEQDGTYACETWIPPGATHRRSYALSGCPHSQGFRQYMAGIMKILVAAGIDGIYLDYSEIEHPFAESSQECFRDFLAARYSAEELKERFNINDLKQALPAADESEPLWAESALFRSASEAEFHRFLRDVAREQDPDFIMAGNFWGAPGFQASALSGRDVQLAGMVDSFLYSEMVMGTENPEIGQVNLPGTRQGVRISAGPAIRELSASSRNGAATSYTYYPQTPNPIPTEEGMFNVHRLAMADALLNHTAFRRIEEGQVDAVKRASKTVYDLLRSVEPQIMGAQMAANVAVVASFQPCYYKRYSYHLEVSRALADAGIAHEMLAPRSLSGEKLAQYRAVVLPNTAVLSDEAYRTLLAYVKSGGTAVVFGEVGTLDLRGDPRPATEGGEAAGFVEVAIDPEKLAADGENISLDAETTRHAAWARGQWPASLEPTMAAVVSAVETAVGDELTARRHRPDSVEISVMGRPESDDLIVNVVSYGVDIDGSVTPSKDIRISVHAPKGKRVGRVMWHPLDGAAETLPTKQTGERTEFTIPTLDIYGIAIVEVKS